MVHRGELVAPRRALPQLLRGFGSELQRMVVEKGYYPEISRQQQISKKFMVYQGEWVAPNLPLPYLSRGFCREFQKNEVELGYYSEIHRLHQITK